MNKLIVLIDLHCDATMPSGAAEFGGGNMYARNLIKCLQRAKIQFIYITRKKFLDIESQLELDNNSIFYRIDIGNFDYKDKDLLQDYLSLAQCEIEKILYTYKTKYQFIFHSFYWQSGILARNFSEIYKTYYIHSVLSNAERKKIQGALSDIAAGRIEAEHMVFEDAKFIICSSQSEYDDMIQLYRLKADKLYITGRWIALPFRFPAYLPNGSICTLPLNSHFPTHYLKPDDINFIDNSGNFWNTKGFVYFGRIHENKGLPQILLAWCKLFNKNQQYTPPLWIIGGTPQQIAKFHQTSLHNIEGLDLLEEQGKIIWWGTLPSEGVSTLLLKGLAVIMHSKYEAGGIVVLEAMSQGVPVIATPFGFAKDYIENGSNGYLINFDDISSLTSCMQYFINQPFLSNYLGRRARQTVSKVLDGLDFTNLHLKLYGLNEVSRTDLRQVIPATDIYKNSIDIFPYLFNLPSEHYIRFVFIQHIYTSIKTILLSSDKGDEYVKWIIKGTDMDYFFYYFYPLLNQNSIYNAEKPTVYSSKERINALIDKIPNQIVLFFDSEKGYILTTKQLEEFE